MQKICCVLLLLLLAGANTGRCTVVTSHNITLTGTYSPLQAENNVYLIYSYDLNGFAQTPQVLLLAAATPGTPTPFSTVFSQYAGTITDEQFAAVSVYNVPSNLVTVSLPTTATGAVGTAFSSYFAGTPEATLAAALENGTTSTISSFYTANISDFAVLTAETATGSLINFSNGALGGGFGVTEVPEPGTWALALLGGGVAVVAPARSRHHRA